MSNRSRPRCRSQLFTLRANTGATVARKNVSLIRRQKPLADHESQLRGGGSTSEPEKGGGGRLGMGMGENTNVTCTHDKHPFKKEIWNNTAITIISFELQKTNKSQKNAFHYISKIRLCQFTANSLIRNTPLIQNFGLESQRSFNNPELTI